MSATELIKKLEGLTGPDREADAEIMFDLFARPVGIAPDGGPVGYLRPDDDPSWLFGIRFPGLSRDQIAASRKRLPSETLVIERDGANVLMNQRRIPSVTASLDEAIAIAERVLPGVELELTNLYNVARATLHHETGQFYGSSESNSLPIAICLAALSALPSGEQP